VFRKKVLDIFPTFIYIKSIYGMLLFEKVQFWKE